MCDRCDSYFVAPCFVNTVCVMLCKDCSELYNAEINKPLLDMSWARAVKEWNSGQIFRDDMYAIPRKTGEYYGEVKEIMDKSKHKKDVEKMMGKEPETPKSLVEKLKDYIGKNLNESKTKNIDALLNIVKESGKTTISDMDEIKIGEYYTNVRNFILNIQDVEKSIKTLGDTESFQEQIQKLNQRIQSYDNDLMKTLNARDEVVMKPGDSFMTQGPGTAAPPKLTEEGNLIQITEDTRADMLKIRESYYKLNKTMQKKEKARYEEQFQQKEKQYDAAVEKLKKDYPKSKYPEKPSFSLMK